jgi:hypothetical protein
MEHWWSRQVLIVFSPASFCSSVLGGIRPFASWFVNYSIAVFGTAVPDCPHLDIGISLRRNDRDVDDSAGTVNLTRDGPLTGAHPCSHKRCGAKKRAP